MRERMGLPPPVPTSEELVGNALAAMQQSNEQQAAALQGLMLRMGVMVETLQKVALHVSASADRIVQATAQVADTTHTASQAAAHIAQQTQSAGLQNAESLLAHFSQRLHNSVDQIVAAFKTPKRAVKDADGSWRTVNVEN